MQMFRARLGLFTAVLDWHNVARDFEGIWLWLGDTALECQPIVLDLLSFLYDVEDQDSGHTSVVAVAEIHEPDHRNDEMN